MQTASRTFARLSIVRVPEAIGDGREAPGSVWEEAGTARDVSVNVRDEIFHARHKPDALRDEAGGVWDAINLCKHASAPPRDEPDDRRHASAPRRDASGDRRHASGGVPNVSAGVRDG